MLSAALHAGGARLHAGLRAVDLLYDVVGKRTFLPLAMDAPRALAVFGMIFAMCAIAGLLAMRKLRDANPADMF